MDVVVVDRESLVHGLDAGDSRAAHVAAVVHLVHKGKRVCDQRVVVLFRVVVAVMTLALRGSVIVVVVVVVVVVAEVVVVVSVAAGGAVGRRRPGLAHLGPHAVDLALALRLRLQLCGGCR